jgi:sulfite reductase (NADPH) flavoprotein alpha-component
LSGLYLRWPAHALQWRSWLALRWSIKGRAFWWELHSVLGTWVLLAYLFAALTGLYWSYDWYRNAMFAVTGAPKPAPQQGGGDKGGDGPAITAEQVALDVRGAWDGFPSTVPSFESATIRMPARAGKPVQVTYLDADPPHLRATNRLQLDPASGKALEHERYADKPVGAKIMSSVYALHTGRFFGMPGVLVLFVASVTMAVSGFSGWLLYLDRRRKKALRRVRALARA